MAGGQSSTVSAGFVNVDKGHGLAAQFAAGTIAAVSLTLALVGAESVTAAGAVSANNGGVVALTGIQSTTAAGTVVTPGAQALIGASAKADIGTLTVVIRPTDISNPAITVSPGIVTAQGNSLTVNITGEDVFTATGFVGSGATLISGQVSTTAAGTTAPAIDIPLAGSSTSVVTGTIAPAQGAVDTLILSDLGSATGAFSVPLVGSVSPTGQGSVGISADQSLALTGSQSTCAAGTIGAEKDFPLVGVETITAQYNVGAPGGASLTGSQVQVIDGNVFITNDRSFAITGQQITVNSGVTFASSLAFPPGQALISDLQGIGPREVFLVGVESQTATGKVAPPLPLSQAAGGFLLDERRAIRKHKREQQAVKPPPEDDPKPIKPTREIVPKKPKVQDDEDAIIKMITDLLL